MRGPAGFRPGTTPPTSLPVEDAAMIVSVKYCRCCEHDRWHELEFAGHGWPGWVRVALSPALALAAALGGRWACGECGNLASDLAALARRPGEGGPALIAIPAGAGRVPAQPAAGRDSAVLKQGSYSR